MKKIRLFFILSLLSFELQAEVLGRLYFQNFLGHVHEEASRVSTSKTIVQCSHSVKLLSEKLLSTSRQHDDFYFVKVGREKGYIQKKNLAQKRPDCFQEKYPKFYQEMKLDITQMYFWARLYDHYIDGKSRIK